MAYKMIFSDLDGTLLNSSSAILSTVRRAITRARDKGVEFVICSGRSHVTLRKFEEMIHTGRGYYFGEGFNGGLIYKRDMETGYEIFTEHRLENASAVDIVRMTEDLHPEIWFYVGSKLIAKEETERVRDYRRHAGVEVQIVPDMTTFREDISKILFCDDMRYLKQVHDRVGDYVNGRCSISYSCDFLLEIGHLKANKGTGLAFLRDYLGINKEDVIAVGDNYNDMEMIKEAGLGIAVANAVPEIKAAADYITKATNDQGAIAEIIETFIEG